MFKRENSMKSQRSHLHQRGASFIEYTLLLGIVATIGISAMRTIGGALADSSDPCNPGLFVKAAMLLGDANASKLQCTQGNPQQ
jgi:hypothetical protein